MLVPGRYRARNGETCVVSGYLPQGGDYPLYGHKEALPSQTLRWTTAGTYWVIGGDHHLDLVERLPDAPELLPDPAEIIAPPKVKISTYPEGFEAEAYLRAFEAVVGSAVGSMNRQEAAEVSCVYAEAFLVEIRRKRQVASES